MPVRCQDCNSHFLLDGTTVAQGIGCPDCGGTKLERDQPSPTHSDGELRNMVDPATQLDQGGNPLQEGVWAGVDGGWQPEYRRDETFAKVTGAIEAAETPPLTVDKSTLPYQQRAPRVMSNHYNRTLPMDPYLPWYHQADAAEDERQRHQDRQNVQSGHRLEWQPGQRGRGIMIAGQLHTWPVDPQSGFKHGEYIRHLGVNPINVDFQTGFEINPDGSMVGENIHPSVTQIDPFLNHGESVFASTKVGIAPLLAIGGRLLLGQAIGGLMRKAIGGQGNFLNQGQQEQPYAGAPPVSLVASERLGVGHNAPVETPDSTPDFVEDHDPEAVDQQEFNDGDHSPAGNNPNLNGEAGGSQNPAGGEDQTVQKLEFRHDGEGVQHAEMLLPVIMQYINSDKSALDNPQLRTLHEQLEKEIPGYLDLADENDESVHKLMEELRKPEHAAKMSYMGPANMPANQNPEADWVQQTRMLIDYYRSIGNEAEAQKLEQTLAHMTPTMPQMAASIHHGAPVYQNTPMPANQMQMGNQQMSMPGTYQNPVQPGGMPVSGKCQNCGGVVNADGSCPQCGAAAGANQMGNMGQQTSLGIMPSPYSHTAADHQGPITPQQKEAFAQHLIQQGRNDEVAPMMGNPAMYADEWAQFINQSTQPPNIDPNEQPAPPQPQMDPSQMGQMPVPGMNIPQPTGKTAAVSKRCPKCQSATTSVMNDEGGMRCHRCQNVWEVDNTVKDKISSWRVVSYPDALNDSPNPVAAPAADATAPGDREQNQDSSMSWQATDGTPLQVGQTYEVHNPNFAIPDVAKVEQVKPDSIVLTMEGEYNSPSDPTDANGPGYQHEIPLQEVQEQGVTFVPVQTGEGEQEQSQDQGHQDGIGQTVNTEPVEQTHDFPMHSNTKESWFGPGEMAQEDPRGQFQLGQEVDYNAYGGRTERGFIVGFDAGHPNADPFIKNRFGQTKLISRQSVGEPIQIAANFVRMAPMSEYDKYFGGESGAAAKAKASMIEEYGEKKGEEVFYATVNKKGSSETELPTDHCPKCEYGHVTSSYNSPTEIQYECFRCTHQWKIAEIDENSTLNPESRSWLEEDDSPGGFNFDRVVAIESAKSSKGRNIRDIAARDPRNKEIHDRLEKNAGAKFSPREQREFVDEEGVARNADRLNLDGTHYIESAFDNSKANPDRVNPNYIGLGL